METVSESDTIMDQVECDKEKEWNKIHKTVFSFILIIIFFLIFPRVLYIFCQNIKKIIKLSLAVLGSRFEDLIHQIDKSLNNQLTGFNT